MSDIIGINGNIVSTIDVQDTVKGIEATVSITQECQDVIDRCTLARNADKLRGHRKTGTYHCVAEIPMALITLLKSQGIDLLEDREAMKKFLNDPAFKAFRTSEGKV